VVVVVVVVVVMVASNAIQASICWLFVRWIFLHGQAEVKNKKIGPGGPPICMDVGAEVFILVKTWIRH